MTSSLTVVIGGGQAGLATSYFLNQQAREHVVLEKAPYLGSSWRDARWDSFDLITPNWTFQLPGAHYDGDAPDAFMPRDEVVSRLGAYAASFSAPKRLGVRVTSVEPVASGDGFVVTTDDGRLEASNVVVAAGFFQGPKSPRFSGDLARRVLQLHSSEYRNPAQLPRGGVLIVGSGQSGCQIAEEVAESGRQVYLSLGSTGRVPRRYRGRDCFTWLHDLGFFEQTPDKLPSPRARFTGNPHLSGQRGGHTINLHQFARDGMILLGRIEAGSGERLTIQPNRNECLAKADAFEARIVTLIDGYVARTGNPAPEEDLPELRDGFAGEEITELDLRAAGIDTIIWSSGFAFDFGWVRFPIFDADGYPLQQGGATSVPGLYFVGLPWLSKYKSGLLVGVGEDAERVARSIGER